MSGIIQVFEEENFVAFFPNVKRHSIEGAIIVGYVRNGPQDELVSLPNRQTLFEIYEKIEDPMLDYADKVLTFSYGGTLLLYRTDKLPIVALRDVLKHKYEHADKLERVLNDIGI